MSSSEGSLDNPGVGVMEVTGRVLIGTIIALVVVLVLVFLFHIYANCMWHRRQQASLNRRRPQDHPTGVTVLRRGLDAAFLNTLPLFQFDPKHFKDGLECSVCLSELEAGEKTRTLPKCNHVFHAECIDMWFHSHSTCPICRNPVADQTQVSVESLLENHQSVQQMDNGGDSHTFPTNVLFWGDETEVSTLTSQLVEASNNNQTPATLPFQQPSSSSSSSSSECTNNDRSKPDLVIDIPRHAGEEEEEGEQTPIMRSLRRILSSSSRFNPFSPRNNVSQQGQS